MERYSTFHLRVSGVLPNNAEANNVQSSLGVSISGDATAKNEQAAGDVRRYRHQFRMRALVPQIVDDSGQKL